MTQPEGKVKKAIKDRMKKMFPSIWGYMPVQSGYGTHGIPDHIFCLPYTITAADVGRTVGIFVGVEAKSAKGAMSEYQILQREGIQNAGGLYITVYGGPDVEEKLSVLEALK
jgi:hypothetical protein